MCVFMCMYVCVCICACASHAVLCVRSTRHLAMVFRHSTGCKTARLHVRCARCPERTRSWVSWSGVALSFLSPLLTSLPTRTVPGKRNCPSGLTYLYDGYVMSYHYTNAHRGEFICVDKDAEGISGYSAGDEGGAALYPTETEGPPGYGYNHDWEVPCVVCIVPVA